MKPGDSLMFLKIPGTDGSLNLIFFSNTHQAAFFFFPGEILLIFYKEIGKILENFLFLCKFD
jgi:hypothetical protein